MRLIDADKFIKALHEEWDEVLVWDESGETTADNVESLVDQAPTVNEWHYSSKGELPKKNVEVLCRLWFGGYIVAHLREDNEWTTNGKNAFDIECWQYIVPPKEEE